MHSEASPEDLQGLLSAEVAHLAFSSHTKKYLKQRGIRYLGELLLVQWDPQRHALKVRQDLDTTLADLGVLGVDPVAVCWHPPYLDDHTTLQLLSQPIGVIPGFGAFYSVDELGYCFSRRSWLSGCLWRIQTYLPKQSGLHAAMYIPVWESEAAEFRRTPVEKLDLSDSTKQLLVQNDFNQLGQLMYSTKKALTQSLTHGLAGLLDEPPPTEKIAVGQAVDEVEQVLSRMGLAFVVPDSSQEPSFRRRWRRARR